MKTLKLLGITALTALIILGITSCDELIPGDEIDGSIEIKTSTYGAYTDKKLTVVYTPNLGGIYPLSYTWSGPDIKDEDIKPVMNNVDSTDPEKKGEFKSSIIPTIKGTYRVVADFGADNFPNGSTLSIDIYIDDAPDYVNCLGTWKMEGALNSFPGQSAPFQDETIIITHDAFKLTSTDSGLDGVGTNKYTHARFISTVEGQEQDYPAPKEYAEYYAVASNAWKKQETTPTTYSSVFTFYVNKQLTKVKGYAFYENFTLSFPKDKNELELIWTNGTYGNSTLFTPQSRTFKRLPELNGGEFD